MTPHSARPASLTEANQGRSLLVWKRFVAERPIPVLPVALILTVLAWLDPAPWRGPLMLGLAATVLALFLLDRLKSPSGEKLQVGNLIVPVLVQAGAVVVTGGLDSPILGVMTGMACLAGGQGAPITFALLQVGLVIAITTLQVIGWPSDLLPAVFGGSARAHATSLVVTTAVVHSVTVLVGYRIGRVLHGAHDAALTETLGARDELLRLSEAHAMQLQEVSGEVSHELKNPLATIRGLAELMAMDTPTGRNAERLAVLHREVLGMQSSIDELLDLARPVSSLDESEVDLGALCDEVCALYEGVSTMAGVSVRREATVGEGITVRADRRKLSRVVANLLKNAIEASPAGGEVTVSAGHEEERAVVTIGDAGPVVDPAVAAQAFTPGLSSKPGGSGLGLTIARALARQHGGDVTLRARAARGCEASVWIPTRGTE